MGMFDDVRQSSEMTQTSLKCACCANDLLLFVEYWTGVSHYSPTSWWISKLVCQRCDIRVEERSHKSPVSRLLCSTEETVARKLHEEFCMKCLGD